MDPKWAGFTSATDESEKSGCHSRAILRSDADLRTPPMNYELLKSRGSLEFLDLLGGQSYQVADTLSKVLNCR